MSDVVLLLSSGKYHRAVRVGRNLLTPEACNADQAEDREILFALPDDVTADQKCRRCYPEDVSPLRDYEGTAV